MKKNSFWSDASRGGAVVGLVAMASSLIETLLPAISFIASLASFVVIIYLLFYYTRKRASLFPDEGYTYSQSLGFIVAVSMFAGIIAGAYQIVASNFLFPEKFEEVLAASMTTMKQMGVYSADMIESMSGMMRAYIFSPMPVLISSIVGNVLYYGFLGLFISIGTKREPEIFDTTDESDEE